MLVLVLKRGGGCFERAASERKQRGRVCRWWCGGTELKGNYEIEPNPHPPQDRPERKRRALKNETQRYGTLTCPMCSASAPLTKRTARTHPLNPRVGHRPCLVQFRIDSGPPVPHSSLGYRTPAAFAASLKRCGKDSALGNPAEDAGFPRPPPTPFKSNTSPACVLVCLHASLFTAGKKHEDAQSS